MTSRCGSCVSVFDLSRMKRSQSQLCSPDPTSFDHFLPCGNLSFCKMNSIHHNFIRNFCKFFQKKQVAQQNEKKHLGVQQLWSHRHQTKLKMVSHERSPPTNSFLWRLHCGKNTPWRPHMILTKNWCWEEFLGCKSELLKFNQHATCTAIAEAKMNGFQLFNAFQFSPGGRLTWWWR